MIQFTVPNVSLVNNKFYLDLYDLYEGQAEADIDSPLVIVKSQLTGKSKAMLPSTLIPTDKFHRYFSLNIITTRTLSETPISGLMRIGDTDFPLGFYDISIYKNTSNTNLDPTGLTLVYTGLAIAKAQTDDQEPINYSEYTTNDSDTESVYITF
tara:strand:+ start:189 stop:650 length:462 start_codon:yes stop_codon:yes gene_type:complete